MARRSSAASRSSRSNRAGGRSGGRAERGPRARTDGKVDAPCPQCGTRYRVAEEALDIKIECQECHRTFFPKTTAGKRAVATDNTKVYVGFGIGAVLIVITFALMSGNNDDKPKQPKPTVARETVYTPGTHPRTAQIVKWAQAIRSQNDLLITTHTDMAKVAPLVEAASSQTQDVIAALLKHPSTQYLRNLECNSGTLAGQADMTAASGMATLFLVPPAGSKDYENDRAEIELTWHIENEQVKVEGWKITRKIIRLTADPNRKGVAVNKHIARAENVEITDSAGTRKVMESEPGPVPHWEKADAVLRAKVDEVIAGVLLSADDSRDPPIPLARYTLKIRSMEERKAAVPRALNAMFELYSDVAANKQKISQLDRALRDWTGFATNFQVADTGDAAKDKKLRESCVRQWFGFWWRYSNSGLEDFLDMRENLDEPLEGEPGFDPDKNKKK